MDDGQLYDAFKAFNSELMQEGTFPNSQRDSTDVKTREARNNLYQAKESLVTLFMTQTKRPPIKKPNMELSEISGDGHSRRGNSDPPDVDRLAPEELVNVVDAMMNAAFRNVTEEVSAVCCTFSGWLADVIVGYPRYLRPSRDPVHGSYWLVCHSRASDQRRRGRSADLPFTCLRS